jgi:tRNA(Ile)-lysidine synthase
MNKSGSDSFIQAVEHSVKKHFTASPYVVMGVSGGCDSMALLYAFHKLGVRTLVVHINYGKRGKESDADQELVEGMCSVWGFECCSVNLSGQFDGSGNFQEWAREQRYQIFNEFREVEQADAVVSAHHQDDQVETILHKILRGAGFTSWSGMSVIEPPLFRPLLAVSKAQILDFCSSEHVPYRDDQSNFEAEFSRNAFRKNVFPVFDSFIPGWEQNVLESAEQAEYADEAVQQLLTMIQTDEQALDLEKLQEFSTGLQGSLLKMMAERLTGKSFSKGEITSFVDVISTQVGTRISVADSWELVRERARLTFNIHQTKTAGNTTIHKKECRSAFSVLGIDFKLEEATLRKTGLELDADVLAWPLQVRYWKHGDKFSPLGLNGSQKVSDWLTNKKIPPTKRNETLILTEADGTICAIILRAHSDDAAMGGIAEKAKITTKSTQKLAITRAIQ